MFLQLLLWVATLGWAETHLRGVEWQEMSTAKRPAYEDVKALKRDPKAKRWARVRVIITLVNDKGPAIEGLVLRYAVVAKIKKVGSTDESRWVVPFRLEERRIPKLSGGTLKRVPIDTVRLENYLKELRVSGYWPEQIKLQVMMQPKEGVHLEHSMIESIVPVQWE